MEWNTCFSGISLHITQNSSFLARYTFNSSFPNSSHSSKITISEYLQKCPVFAIFLSFPNIFRMAFPNFCYVWRMWILVFWVLSLNCRNLFSHIFFWYFQIWWKMVAFVSHRALRKTAWKVIKKTRYPEIRIRNGKSNIFHLYMSILNEIRQSVIFSQSIIWNHKKSAFLGKPSI